MFSPVESGPLAKAAHKRFEELERTYPADLSKHLKDLERLAVKNRIVEDRQAIRGTMPGSRVQELEFSDGSKLRIGLTKIKIKGKGDAYRWTGCRVL